MVLPDVSNVPLTKDILAEKQTFVFTYYEWLERQGQIISTSADIEAPTSSKTIYTVPKGFVFFLKNIWLQAHNHSGANDGSVWFNVPDFTQTPFLLISTHAVPAGNAVLESNAVINFSTPMQFNEGALIKLFRSAIAGNSGYGGIIGFLVRKDVVAAAF